MRIMFFRAGQATLVVLLLGLLGLTVALSAISSSLKDVRQSTGTDFGTKALAGAESVLEYGITKVDPNANYPPPGVSGQVALANFPGFASGYQGDYTIKDISTSYAEYKRVGVDDAVTLNGIKVSNPTNLYLLWKGNNNAILVTALYQKANEPLVLQRYAFNSATFGGVGGNNFITSFNASVANCRDSVAPLLCRPDPSYNNCTVKRSSTTNFTNQIPYSLGSGHKLHSLRVRPLYSGTDVAICAMNISTNTSEDLGAQTILVTGKASTTDGTTRRVQATLSSTGLPGLFDYALYTEGDLSK